MNNEKYWLTFSSIFKREEQHRWITQAGLSLLSCFFSPHLFTAQSDMPQTGVALSDTDGDNDFNKCSSHRVIYNKLTQLRNRHKTGFKLWWQWLKLQRCIDGEKHARLLLLHLKRKSVVTWETSLSHTVLSLHFMNVKLHYKNQYFSLNYWKVGAKV